AVRILAAGAESTGGGASAAGVPGDGAGLRTALDDHRAGLREKAKAKGRALAQRVADGGDAHP
ncbi:MAG TPA: hypothetical protein VK039_07850, partial [Brevibacterium sp.]|nr:hypothetical protein [Brevibacterium sp.]